MTTPVEVARCRYRHEAEMAQGRLTDAGIPSWVFGGDIGGASPGVGSVRLVVAPADADRARELLQPDEE
ncbi:MAG: DUF2007 domain-containing protein [Gemmatimonadota bacterium]